MSTIETKDLELIVGDVTLAKAFNVSADEAAKARGESVSCTLELQFAGAKLRSVFYKVLSSVVITEQRKLRAKVAAGTVTDGHKVVMKFTGGPIPFAERFKAMSKKEQLAHIAELTGLMNDDEPEDETA